MSRRRTRDGDEIRNRGQCSTSADVKEDARRSQISRFAKVTTLATEQSHDDESTSAKLQEVDGNLLKRIQKMLKLAQHPNTSEAEAKQAIRATTRMLSAYNLTEADVMSHESTSEQLQRAGHSIVTVRHREGKDVSLESWSLTLGHAICLAFNVKFFYTRYTTHEKIEFTFYGLRDNTATAAMSFEAIFNLALTWALQRLDVRGRSGKNSYLIGLSDSLYRIAKSEKKEEEIQAIECERRTIEEAERKAKEEERTQRSRLAEQRPTKETRIEDEEEEEEVIFVSLKRGRRACGSEDVKVKLEQIKEEETDDDAGEDNFDGLGLRSGDLDEQDDADVEEVLGDADTERKRFDRAFDAQRRDGIFTERDPNVVHQSNDSVDIKREDSIDVKPSVIQEDTFTDQKMEQEDGAEVPTWQSHAQLTLFKETASKLAEEYLKTLATKVKTTKARARNSTYDNDAYRKGVEDAKKVDLKRRRLE